MRLLRNISRLGRRLFTPHRIDDPHTTVSALRICRFEQFESRQLMTADVPAIIVGGTEYEQAAGNDSQANVFVVTFQGGAAGTQLTHLEINGSKNGGPLNFNDAVFDTTSGGLGAYQAHNIKILSHDGFDVLSTSAIDGSTLLTMDFSGFKAGMTLVFSVDVDQVIYVDPSNGSVEVDAVDEGAEFQRSQLVTSFTAPHYEDITTKALYWDVYDDKIAAAEQQAGSTINLPNDSYTDAAALSSLTQADGPSDHPTPTVKDVADMTTAAVSVIKQTPLPITLKGEVYEDHNLNNQINPGDQGVAGVPLALWQFDGTTYVNTGKTTTTDAQGNYTFTGLLPGTYQVVKVNPSGYFSVGASVGKVGPTPDGQVVSPDVLSQITLQGGDDSVDNDFALALPAALSGYVYHDLNNDGKREPGEAGIGGVTISIVPVQVFGVAPAPIQVVTAADGSYSVSGLNPGQWKVVEVTQPAGYLDGLASAGTAGGIAINPGDRIENIFLGDNQKGEEYDFGKLLPNSISGRVVVTTYQDCADDPNPTPISGVAIELWNSSGQVIASTTTDSQGNYQFNALPPGTYSVHEIQPLGYIEGDSDVGSAGGVSVNSDLISTISLISDIHAVHYDFCEHPYSSLSGVVHIDVDGNCDTNPNEPTLAGVTIQLLDANNQVIATTITDAHGAYTFDHLTPGLYSVRELQPAGYYFDDAHAGSVGGTVADNHTVTQITVPLANDALNYNFCVVPPGSIAGFVHKDVDGNCDTNPNEPGIQGVTIQLLNSEGAVVQVTTTDAAGHYVFQTVPPGSYTVHELQPTGYFSEDSHPGSTGGVSVDDDTIGSIQLDGGVDSVDNNFCEQPPDSIAGYVYYDKNDDGKFDAGDTGVANVTVQLRDSAGNPTGATAVTDSQGHYQFTGLKPGVYGVGELPPSGYLLGATNVGSAGGAAVGQTILGAVLGPAVDATDYNFGLLLPAGISGRVQVNPTGDCEGDTVYPGAPNVTINLLDASHKIVATTTTNANGEYSFTGLEPGEYSVQEILPNAYFAGDSDVGTEGGNSADATDITDIVLGSGVTGLHYDFCVVPPASLSGTVFQDGPAILVLPGQTLDVPAVRDGVLSPGDPRIAGVTLELRDGVTGLPIYGASALPGTYQANAPITTVTDANGNYSFVGLKAGNYSVFEVRPAGYIDGINTAGTTGGIAIDPYANVDPAALGGLQVPAPADAILQIVVVAGASSESNNFSVVLVGGITIFNTPPPTSTPLVSLSPYLADLPNQAPPQQPLNIGRPPVYSGSSNVLNTTWHLSVVDAGQPRGASAEQSLVRLTAAQADDLAWQSGMEESEWTIGSNPATGRGQSRRLLFGMKGGIPISGDFNGDGVSEIGVFKDGQWFIDLNGNSVWDEGDLWAKLGHEGDKPVVGDWDGDGKDDIGIFGRAWAGDPKAVRHEPGMPDSHNDTHNGYEKNVPPTPDRAAMGKRSLKVTSQGQTRADVIDHVFLYGTARDLPLVGDWNGDGTDTIAVFSDGVWYLDWDGDGKHTLIDKRVDFGQKGDIPVAADFNGDGVDELAVFRGGVLYVDSNNNGQLDADDLVIKLGQEGDVPVAGDWDGDGREELGVYRDGSLVKSTARRP